MRINSPIAALLVVLFSAEPTAAADPQPTSTEAPALPHHGEAQPGEAPQEERGIWAAIAYSSIDTKHGFFWGADKREEAKEIALEHCQDAGGEACAVVTVFRNHRHLDDDDETGFPYHPCGALAVGEEGSKHVTPWAAQSAPTLEEAEEQALKACERAGGQCSIREWVCT